ncbi:MAG: DUF6596 domain-containing protein [Gemmatimonadaceae bacterium]
MTPDVYRLLPSDAKVGGLLALMLLTDARRAARTGEHGELVPLDEHFAMESEIHCRGCGYN